MGKDVLKTGSWLVHGSWRDFWVLIYFGLFFGYFFGRLSMTDGYHSQLDL